jgi:hypothetical protein
VPKSFTRITQDAQTAADILCDGAIQQIRDTYEANGYGTNTTVYHEAINQVFLEMIARIRGRLYDFSVIEEA